MGFREWEVAEKNINVRHFILRLESAEIASKLKILAIDLECFQTTLCLYVWLVYFVDGLNSGHEEKSL